MNKEFWLKGENPELDNLLAESPDFFTVSGEIFEYTGLLTLEMAQFYYERFLAENKIVNSPLYKSMKEEE